MPGLLNNLNLIVNTCELEIISIYKLEKETNEEQKNLKYGKENLEQILSFETDHMRTLPKTIRLVEQLTKQNKQVQTDFATEFKEFGFGCRSLCSTCPQWTRTKYVLNEFMLRRRWRDGPVHTLQEFRHRKTAHNANSKCKSKSHGSQSSDLMGMIKKGKK